LKNVTDNHCSTFYDKAIKLIEKRTNYEEALVHINKCLLLKPFHIPYYEIRSEIYLNLCDFQSSILSLQKSILYTQPTTTMKAPSNSQLSISDHQPQSISMPVTPANRDDQFVNDKIAFLRFISGISLFDQKLYLDALGIIANGANIFSTLPFQIYSILCLTALNKIEEASTLITQLIEQYPQNADLLIIRARLYYKDKEKLPLCYYDVRDALAIEENHPLAKSMMAALEEAAQQARDGAIRLSINDRLSDALAAINFSIQLYPIEAEFHLQRF
jgi:tetratricopeptide (TPR) repeat protein